MLNFSPVTNLQRPIQFGKREDPAETRKNESRLDGKDTTVRRDRLEDPAETRKNESRLDGES